MVRFRFCNVGVTIQFRDYIVEGGEKSEELHFWCRKKAENLYDQFSRYVAHVFSE